ncbi:hypothetical protein ACTXG7_13135 [Mycolicibacterium sp. Dal123E01]|uniref:hypothetical protein n=1 Tax=Mycolicibacterium sp. Dal123E01 TaxID=3457578 RepID=UPI00403E7B5A
MNSGHVIGYVGGLAVALGVGAAVWLGTPTASADTRSAAASSGTRSAAASSGTATSARAAHRTNTVAARKPAPARKTAASAAAAPANSLRITTDYDADDKPVTQVAVINSVTGAQVGTTIAIEGSPGTPAYSTDGQHAVITTAFDEIGEKSTSHLAVINTITGAQVGDVLTLAGDSTFAPPLIVTPDASRVLTIAVFSGADSFARLVDTTTGAWEGFSVRGYPDRAPTMAPDGVHALITTTYYDYDLGDTLVSVMDVETATRPSPSVASVRVDGIQYGDPIITADGHAVITTSFTNSTTGGVSTRVAVIDAATGKQIGTTGKVTGRILDSAPPTLDVDRVVFRTSAEFKVTVNTATGAVQTTSLANPWVFNLNAFWRSPLGAAVAPGLFVLGFLGSAILGFYILPAIVAIPAWITEIFGV